MVLQKMAGDSLKIQGISQEKWKERQGNPKIIKMGQRSAEPSLAVPVAWGWHSEAEDD